MRIFSNTRLLSLALVPLFALASMGQEEPAKPAVKPATKPASISEQPAPEQPSAKPKAEPVAATEKVSDEPAKDKRQNKANEKKPDKTSPDADKKKVEEKATQKPTKPEPPEKKILANVGSLKNSKIPGQPWLIHDLKRPRPKAVTPGVIDTMPPADAVVLFDGTNLNEWYQVGSEDEAYEAQWKIHDGYFEVEPKTGSMVTLNSYGSCQLHIEWMIPEGTTGASQGRGNSGIKLMERYEVQILDSYKNRTYADGQAASIYGQYPPMINAVRQQGEWQTYDIVFEAPTYENGKMKKPPVVTVIHNGVLVHHHRELAGPTGLRGSAQEEVPPAAPLTLQDHGNRIRFRNIWLREL